VGPRIRIQNPQTGDIWESADLLRIGRNPNTDIQLYDRMVSRFHALLWTDLSQWWIRDLQSRNGTRVNGEPLRGERQPIQGGDELDIGGSRLRVLGILLEEEQQWKNCDHALSMLETLHYLDWNSAPLQRKLRLWVYACLLPAQPASEEVRFVPPHQHKVESSEELPRLDLQHHYQTILAQPERTQSFLESPPSQPHELPFQHLLRSIHRWHGSGYREYADMLTHRVSPCRAARLLRCALGNPWKPPRVLPHWLHWQDGLVGQLALLIAREGRLELLPILADALEDAGCQDEELLSHLRESDHCPACWALDALLGQHPPLSVLPK